LQLTPVRPNFEKLTVQFSDQEYQFQSNTVDYLDQDLAARNNRIQNPLAATFSVSACPTKSQAARIAIARAREEMGGYNQAEQDMARAASWKSTILALDTEAGSVVSITDPDVPGGTMAFRVQTMRINKDWSVDLIGKTVTAGMYDATVGPKPADVQSPPVPTEPPRDSDIPPAPGFGANLPARSPAGFLELMGLSFPDTTNTLYITSGNFAIYYVDDSTVEAHLAANITAGATSMSVDSWGSISPGDLIEMDGEIILVGPQAGSSATISRAQKMSPASAGGSAAPHMAGAAIRKVQSITRNESFPPNFFAGIGTPDVNPALINWTLDIPLPNRRVLAGECVMVNAYGPSPTGSANWTNNTTNGLVIGSAPPAKVTQVNANTTLAAEPQTCEADATNGAFTITLPPLSAWIGDDITLVKVDPTANVVAWQTSSSSDAVTGIGTSGTLTTQGQAITITATQA
jgi:hypothetical protein